MIFHYPWLLESLLRVDFLDINQSIHERAGLSLMDLTAEPKQSKWHSSIDKQLDMLAKLAILENSPDTLESAIVVLQNLVIAKDNHIHLVTDGLPGVEMEVLHRKAIGSDGDIKVHQCAARALNNHCLSFNERMHGMAIAWDYFTCLLKSAHEERVSANNDPPGHSLRLLPIVKSQVHVTRVPQMLWCSCLLLWLIMRVKARYYYYMCGDITYISMNVNFSSQGLGQCHAIYHALDERTKQLESHVLRKDLERSHLLWHHLTG